MHNGVSRYLAGQKDHVVSDRAAVDHLGDELPHIPHFTTRAEEHAHARLGYCDGIHPVTPPAASARRRS
jgi:hypothetical protein